LSKQVAPSRLLFRPLAGSPLTEELRASPPHLHGSGEEFWGLAWPALAWLERTLAPGMATLETGAGASTIVFAASGAHHVAITVDAGEEERIRAECVRRGIDDGRLSFVIGPSHEVLASAPAGPLDLVLVDGAHGFPHPILDWWHLAPRLRVDGLLVLDDCYMPPVGALVDYLRTRPEWEVADRPGRRTVVLRKLAEAVPSHEWHGERVGSGLSFRYLPPPRRLRAAVAHRFFESAAGRRAAAFLRHV